MRILLSTVLLCFSACAHAQTQSVLPSAAGLWQFGRYSAWVLIGRDGTAFQCRVAPNRTVYASQGSFATPDAIHWQKIWGVDQVSLHEEVLVLKGRYGSFEFRRTSQAMEAACMAARQADTSSERERVPPADQLKR